MTTIGGTPGPGDGDGRGRLRGFGRVRTPGDGRTLGAGMCTGLGLGFRVLRDGGGASGALGCVPGSGFGAVPGLTLLCGFQGLGKPPGYISGFGIGRTAVEVYGLSGSASTFLTQDSAG